MYRWICLFARGEKTGLEIGETARLIGPKRCGFNSFSSDFAGQIADTKKPAGLAPCGLSGLLRMTLESSSKDFGGLGESELVI